MAEETDLSRTEPASPRRLQQARAEGDVPRSSELTAWVVLLSALLALNWLAPRLLQGLGDLLETALREAARPAADTVVVGQTLELLLLFLPVLVAVFVAALVAPALLSGWVFAPRTLRADLTRLNPVRPLTRLLSPEAWFDLGKTLLKLVLVAAAVGWAVSTGWSALPGLPLSDPEAAGAAVTAWIGRGLMAVLAALAIVAVLDGGWRWWRYLRRHAMTWQEVLAEAREAEGSPEMRARMRQRQGENRSARAAEGASAATARPDEARR